MPEVIKNSENLLFVDRDLVDQVKEEARKSPRLLARLLMHLSHDDPVQEMLIALCRDCVVAPNRAIGRSESLLVVEGDVLLIVFDEDGRVVEQVEMGPPGGDKAFLYRFSSTTWHTMVPLTEIVVVHEALQGPFDQSSDPQPDWIPEDPAELKSFLSRAAADL